MFAADPGRLDVKAGSKDVVAFSVVGEVRTLIRKGGSANGYGLGCGCGRVVARVGIVITGSDGKMNASINGSVDGEIQCDRLATTETHVGGTSLETLLTFLRSLHLLRVADGGPFDTFDDIGHGTGPVRPQHLDGVDVGFLGDTELLARNRTRAVSAVTVSVYVFIVGGDGLSPMCPILKVDVLSVGTSVNDIDVNTLATIGTVEVFVEGSKAKAVTVGYSGQAPRSVLLSLPSLQSVNFRVLFDIINLVNTGSSQLCFVMIKQL